MKTFLEYVANDIISKYGCNLSDTAIVFPNKRAALFLNDYLAHAAGKPLWSPVYMTISELFRMHSKLTVCDDIKLICDLHKCFTKCTGIDETLDHFYGWGQVLLADFDDIDKNMAEADKVFANLKNIHELDDISYLNKEQVDVIKKFFSNFSENHNTELKKRFLNLWSHFHDIYLAFNDSLHEEGFAYEGALYRRVVTDGNIAFKHGRYIFVGFNVLQRVERKLFSILKKDGRAKFYWDFDKYYLPSKQSTDNEAGYYIAQYLNDFPNELDSADNDIYNCFSTAKEINYMASPTENIQARYIGKWLQGQHRIKDGRRTAIVLCDESLLTAVIHCLPDNLEKVNVTTGYPLSQSPFSTLVTALISLQANGCMPAQDRYRLSYVNAVLRHPYSKYISSNCSVLLKRLNETSRALSPSRAQLAIDPGTELLFCNFDKEHGHLPLVGRITLWIKNVLKHIAGNAKSNTDPFFGESLFRMYTIINRLYGLISTGNLSIDVVTLQRLVKQVVSATSIPFHGEPAVGLQIMGVLETRNLDFEHLLILSCNEGNMPKGVNDTSFIPYNLRKAYGLTTVDHKVAIYSYYFYRLLQRASDITIMYNNSTNNGNVNETSRFMQQIMVESGHHIIKKTLLSGHAPAFANPQPVCKGDSVMQRLLERFDIDRNPSKAKKPLLTPSAINKYMRCQLQFYYNYVCNIKESDENDGKLDGRIFGNIFHSAAQTLYGQLAASGKAVKAGDFESMLNSDIVVRAVDDAFRKEYFMMDGKCKKQIEYNGFQLINREVIITYLQRLLEIDKRQAPIYIVGTETDVVCDFRVEAGSFSFNTYLGGRVDRIDMVVNNGTEHLRVVDYKTGSGTIKSLKNLEAVFDLSKMKEHSDYYLQALLYSVIVHGSQDINPQSKPVSPALLFIQHAVGDKYSPTLCFDKEPINDISVFKERFFAFLGNVVNEIFNPQYKFTPTADDNICKTCPYKLLCSV